MKKGEIIENRLTGEKIIFTETAAETNGEYLRYDYFQQPGSPIESEHVHTEAEQTVTVIKGKMTIEADKEKIFLEPGESHTIMVGTAHRGWNSGNEVLQLKAEIKPAMNFEGWYKLCSYLADKGKTSKNGTPGLLQLAVFMYENKNQSFFPKFIGIQKAFINICGPLGKLFGYKSSYN